MNYALHFCHDRLAHFPPQFFLIGIILINSVHNKMVNDD